jgi:ABC-type transporter Mla MlaB component
LKERAMTISTQVLCLPAELTIYTATETRAAWLGWLAGDGSSSGHEAVCEVDAASVDEVDAAGVQLLVALAHSLQRQHSRLRLHEPSQPLRQACLDLGVAGLLIDDPQVAPSADACEGGQP